MNKFASLLSMKIPITSILFFSTFMSLGQAQAVMNTDLVKIGEHGIWFIASRDTGDEYVSGSTKGPGEIETNPIEYVGTSYLLDSWMVPVGDHLNVNCKSTISVRVLRDGTTISPGLPVSVEDGNDFRIEDYKVTFDKVGTYTAKISGGLNCYWRTDGRTDYYPADKTYLLAKVIKRVSPREVSISSVNCPKPFKISVSQDSRNVCKVVIIDRDHVIDKLEIGIVGPSLINFQNSVGKNWIRNKSGWTVNVSVPVRMVSPATSNNLRKIEYYKANVVVYDSVIRSGEKFTEKADLSYSLFNVTFAK